MGRKCFVPGCKTGYDSEAKKGNRYSLFKAANLEQLENWRKIIPRADRMISATDSVCELHFTEDDIERYFETTLFDGSKFKLERAVPLIKKDAIPTIFPNLPRYSSNIRKLVQKIKSPVQHNSIVEKKARTSFVGTEVEDEVDEVEDQVVEIFNFNVLLRNTESITKPDTLWGVSAHDNFVMCAKWNEDHILEKRVIINFHLNVKAFLKDREIDLENSIVNSVADISSILQEVDNYKLS